MMNKFKTYLKQHHRINCFLANTRNLFFIICDNIFILIPIKKNKIVISNYYGKGYGDNGKYITEELIKQGLNYDIVWLLKKELSGKVGFPSQVRCVKYGGLRSRYELATAKVWIDNCRKMYAPPKRENQYYIQTWHGGLGIKKIEKDVENALGKNYISCAKRDSKMADLFLSNGNHISNLYRNSFWYDGQILKCGSPRNDIMFTSIDTVRQKVLEYFKITEDVKIVLYAPTYRKSYTMENYGLDYFECISALHKRFGGIWIFLVRLHPNISEKACRIKYNDKIYNATDYDDMQELLVSSDVLITDYSSSMFDFALKRYPCFICATDVEEYMKDRNFYFHLNELPFPVASDSNELANRILSFNEDTYIKDLEKLMESQGIIEDGMASKRVVAKIKEAISNIS